MTDGAWGTALQALGLKQGECADMWNLSQPDKVFDVARSYVEAGSEIILTNTFRVAGEASNRAGVEISCRAAKGRAKVFASVGPGAKRNDFAALAEAGASGLVIETMTSLEEASAALCAAKWTGLPVVMSFAFGYGSVELNAAVERMEAEGAFAIGVNCHEMPATIALCRQLRARTKLPVWAKPNAGVPRLERGRAIYAMTAAEFASGALALREAGAGYVGGCCGTTAQFVRAAAEAFVR